MKYAVQFGAGNIGRGFIGAVLSQAGYHVTFADVNQEIIDRINKDGKYVVHVMDVECKDITITDIDGVNSGTDAIIEPLVKAEIVTTAVGLRILQYIAPAIAKGIAERMKRGVEAPLNIVACENGLKASSQLKEHVYKNLDPETAAWAEKHVGFADCSVDRIVPPVRSENPIDVVVENFYEWNVEEASFVGGAPHIDGMNLASNLIAYIERKLFTLNTGHAITAYLGQNKGYKTIDEAIADPEIYAVVKAAMCESGEGLVKKHGFDHEAHFKYIDKIIKRFKNPYLKDDVTRVGREPMRKLSENDRLVLPTKTAQSYGLLVDNLVKGIAAALRFQNPEDPQAVEIQNMVKELGIEAAAAKILALDQATVDKVVAEYAKLN